jgi:hypothetical protein
MAYAGTTVPVEKSQGEVRKLLTDFGATRFVFGEEVDDDGVRWALVQFSRRDMMVRLRVPHKALDERAIRAKVQRARSKTTEDFRAELDEQEAKRIWRVIAWNLKARMVSVEEGVETFEEAFFSHIVTPTGETVWEAATAGHLVLDGQPILGQALLEP